MPNVFLTKAKKKNLTFGNIQKLLNMAAKYAYFACFRNPDLRNRFQCCDCPMDRKMITAVRRNYKVLKGISRNKTIPGIDDDVCTPAGWGKLAWSSIAFSEDASFKYYERFQKMVRELSEAKGMIPVEYDFWLWNQL